MLFVKTAREQFLSYSRLNMYASTKERRNSFSFLYFYFLVVVVVKIQLLMIYYVGLLQSVYKACALAFTLQGAILCAITLQITLQKLTINKSTQSLQTICIYMCSLWVIYHDLRKGDSPLVLSVTSIRLVNLYASD